MLHEEWTEYLTRRNERINKLQRKKKKEKKEKKKKETIIATTVSRLISR